MVGRFASGPETVNIDVDQSDLGQNRLRSDPVAGVDVIPLDRVVLVVAQMLRHLLLKRGSPGSVS
jgi:hypothetical protein